MYTTCAGRLAYLRKKQRLTQEELAKLVDLCANTIGEYELGKSSPQVEDLAKFAEALKIKDPRELIEVIPLRGGKPVRERQPTVVRKRRTS